MAGAGGSMMAPPVLEGAAESGFGVKMGGFHCPVIEYGKRILDLLAKYPDASDVVSHEENGYVTAIVMSREMTHFPAERVIGVYRREPHKFFQELPRFLASTKAQYVDRLVLTGSLGSISLTLLYRPVSPSA